jgi:hypothetical protein
LDQNIENSEKNVKEIKEIKEKVDQFEESVEKVDSLEKKLEDLKVEVETLKEKLLSLDVNLLSSLNRSNVDNFVFSNFIENSGYFIRGFNINTKVFMLLEHYRYETGLKQKDIVSEAIFLYIYEKTNSKETKYVENFLLKIKKEKKE